MFEKPRGVLFDLDGTLVDTAPDLGHAANAVRTGLNLPPLELESYRPFASGGARGLLKVALGIDDTHPDFPVRREVFLSVYRQNLSRDSRMFDGISTMLESLEAAGIAWGIVTNKPEWLALPLLRDLDLVERAACAIGAQERFNPKPAPDLLLHACSEIDIEPKECIYVGDDQRDIDAARAAGMRSVAVAWGYIGTDQDIANWGADAVIETPGELVSLWA